MQLGTQACPEWLVWWCTGGQQAHFVRLEEPRSLMQVSTVAGQEEQACSSSGARLSSWLHLYVQDAGGGTGAPVGVHNNTRSAATSRAPSAGSPLPRQISGEEERDRTAWRGPGLRQGDRNDRTLR
jgi:hypothetical protein